VPCVQASERELVALVHDNMPTPAPAVPHATLDMAAVERTASRAALAEVVLGVRVRVVGDCYTGVL
jgi:hypothetical protein